MTRFVAAELAKDHWFEHFPAARNDLGYFAPASACRKVSAPPNSSLYL